MEPTPGTPALGRVRGVRDTLTTLAFLLPFRGLKIRLLNRLGHKIHPSAYIGVVLVRHVGRFELAEGAAIGTANIFTNLDRVEMGRGARVAFFNWILAGQTLEEGQAAGNRVLRMGSHSHIITWHHVDCSGGVILGDDCWIAGMKTTVLSHAFDPHEGGIIHEPVELKQGAVVSTNCTLLPGTVLGEKALMAAGSTAWTRQSMAGGSLHGGVPARRLGPVNISEWVYNRHRYQG